MAKIQVEYSKGKTAKKKKKSLSHYTLKYTLIFWDSSAVKIASYELYPKFHQQDDGLLGKRDMFN